MDGMREITNGPGQYPPVFLSDNYIYMILVTSLHTMYISAIFGLLPLSSISGPYSAIVISRAGGRKRCGRPCRREALFQRRRSNWDMIPDYPGFFSKRLDGLASKSIYTKILSFVFAVIFTRETHRSTVWWSS